eukprot:g13219.t1
MQVLVADSNAFFFSYFSFPHPHHPTKLSALPRDAKCGKIQCQGGNDRPILGSNAEILVTNIKLGPQEYSCRGTFFNFGEDIADPALVMPGTVCGHRKVRGSGRCRRVSAEGAGAVG